MTYDLLASSVLTSSASSVTFSSISQDYRDLILVCDALAFTSNASGTLQFNGDTASNYSFVYMYGDGSSAASFTSSGTFIDLLFDATNTNRSISLLSVMDYSATDKHKSVLVRTDTGFGPRAIAGRYASTNAITSLTVNAFGSFTYASGSTFYLYGVAA